MLLIIVDKMLYLLRPENEKLKKEAKLLKLLFEEKCPNFTSTQSTGVHATSA